MAFLASSGGQAAVVLGAACALIAALFWVAVHFAYKNGWDDRGLHEQNRRNTRAIRARSAPPARLIGQPQVIEQPWPHHGYGRHSVWAQRMSVRTDTLSFAGGPSTVPISHLTNSGEIRALVQRSDRYIDNMGRDSAAYRRQHASSGARGNSFASGASNWQGPGIAGHASWGQAMLMASQPNQWRDGQ